MDIHPSYSARQTKGEIYTDTIENCLAAFNNMLGGTQNKVRRVCDFPIACSDESKSQTVHAHPMYVGSCRSDRVNQITSSMRIPLFENSPPVAIIGFDTAGDMVQILVRKPQRAPDEGLDTIAHLTEILDQQNGNPREFLESTFLDLANSAQTTDGDDHNASSNEESTAQMATSA